MEALKAVLFLCHLGRSYEQDAAIFFSPSFYEASVPENIATPHDVLAVATVSSSSSAPKPQYRMTSTVDSRSQDLFSIDVDTGQIRVVKSLDREQMDAHFFKVHVVSGSHEAVANVKIVVEDVNDNFPLFEQSVYNINVFESTPISSPVLSIRANDADAGQNGTVAYSIEKNGFFEIDPTTGTLALLVSYNELH